MELQLPSLYCVDKMYVGQMAFDQKPCSLFSARMFAKTFNIFEKEFFLLVASETIFMFELKKKLFWHKNICSKRTFKFVRKSSFLNIFFCLAVISFNSHFHIEPNDFFVKFSRTEDRAPGISVICFIVSHSSAGPWLPSLYLAMVRS